MSIIFKAKTQEGYTVKILAELLQHNIKTACFEIDETGIKLKMMDSHRRILINTFLQSENFTIYKFKNDNSPLYLGINLNHFHKMLKSIKKKDSILLFIKDNNRNDLGIKVLPKENNRVTTSYVKIQPIQTIDISLPTGYMKPIIVPSNEYQKMCKDMNNIGNIINVVSKGFYIKFLCNAGSIYKREVAFGELNDDDDSDDDMQIEEYTASYDTEQLCRIIKIAGLSNTMQIYPANNLPLLFKSKVGNLGDIEIFIKNKKQVEDEEFKNSENSSDSDDDT